MLAVIATAPSKSRPAAACRNPEPSPSHRVRWGNADRTEGCAGCLLMPSALPGTARGEALGHGEPFSGSSCSDPAPCPSHAVEEIVPAGA
ncbi:hypothetical protein llap_11732 [Limosa lapponica baueri]|uniref:Uncharacterized protein n=1 Tax=Limosa lapponica baueri TaxID=1758121 RepID=A0A2I0TW12_LIMLA|nr:hypothetical protein llap_11732 [Limosa lapponica baueri]